MEVDIFCVKLRVPDLLCYCTTSGYIIVLKSNYWAIDGGDVFLHFRVGYQGQGTKEAR